MTDSLLVDDLDVAIEDYKTRGYRLDMISPADNPREARMSQPKTVAGGCGPALRLVTPPTGVRPPAVDSQWIRGRAGMEYRDLIPDRLNGKIIASHIRLTEGGEVPDYVHYHKIDSQVIYCVKGRIKVVYEDQGKPFWLERGDLVLQPPEIRHRVLECTPGAEVIEITSPAEHETWVEHEMQLPNGQLDPQRSFGGQRFFRHKFRESDARDLHEQRLCDFANSISNALTEEDVLAEVTTFSQSLCRA